MDYREFCKLVDGGEQESVIFKHDCNALGHSTAENAVLARDIIALANLRGITGYILIGVSNDPGANGRHHFKSFGNPNFTEERLQAFCKTVIFPAPTVVLTRLNIGTETAVPEHRHKMFVMIKVGPHSTGVFRFNQDFIDHHHQVHFLKNEVWIRRNNHSVLAAPEDIYNLFTGITIPRPENVAESASSLGNSTVSQSHLQEKPAVNEPAFMILPKRINHYSKMPYERARAAILTDLKHLALKAGGKLYNDGIPHLVLPVNGSPVLFRVIITDKCVAIGQVMELIKRNVTFEQGVFLVVIGEMAADALENCNLRMAQSWGCFFTGEVWRADSQEKHLNLILPRNIKEQICVIELPGFSLTNIDTSKKLHHTWDELLNTLKQNVDIPKIILHNYQKMIIALTVYVKEGCPKPAAKNYLPKRLLANEIYDPEKYGNNLLVKQPETAEAIMSLMAKNKLSE